MSLISIENEEDPWLTEFAALQRLTQDINNQINERDTKNSPAEYNRISARIRIKLKQFENEITQLQKKLQVRNNKLITDQERERRSRDLEILASRKIQLDSRFQNVPGSAVRAELFENAGVGSSSHDDAILQSTDTPIENFRQEQKQIMREQDKGLENLSKVISRQKHLAMNIGTEIDDQNVILDHIAGQMDNTDVRVQRETRNVGSIATDDSTCGYWIVIISLFVAIVIVGIVF